MSRPFYSDAKTAKMCRTTSSSSSSHFLFPRDFLGTSEDTDITNAAILKKTVKSLHICDRSTDLDEIWHVDAHWPATADRPLKFRLFENPKWQWPPS